MQSEIYRKLLIIFLLLEFLAYADMPLFNMSEEYKICKKPISIESFLNKNKNKKEKNYDIESLENVYFNLQHFHFFKIEKNDNMSYNYCKNPAFKYIDNSNTYWNQGILHSNLKKMLSSMKINQKVVGVDCNNDFSNFGFFEDSSLHCSEDIKNYTKCSSETINGAELSLALNMLLTDYFNLQYDSKYNNCQVFTENLLETLDYIKTHNSAVCIACPQCWINYNKSYFDILIDKDTTSGKKHKIKWELNNLYK